VQTAQWSLTLHFVAKNNNNVMKKTKNFTKWPN